MFRRGRSSRDGEDVIWRLWVVRWYVVDANVVVSTRKGHWCLSLDSRNV